MASSREMNVSSEGLPATVNGSEVEPTSAREIEVNNSVLYAGVVVCSLGLLLNILTVIAISRVKKNDQIRRQHTYFLLNIMICDIIISATGLANFCLKLHEYQLFGHELNRLNTYDDYVYRMYLQCAEKMVVRFSDMGTTANLFGLLLMSLDHFILVRFSLRHRILMRKGVVFSLLTVSWIASAALSMTQPMMVLRNRQKLIEYITEYYGDDETTYCFLETFYSITNRSGTGEYVVPLDQQLNVHIQLWIGVTLLALTFGVMIAVHSYIAVVIVRMNNQQQRRLRGCNAVAKQREARLQRGKTKGLCTTVLLLGAFAVVWLPLKVAYILDLTENITLDQYAHQLLYRWLQVVLSTTALLDVAVYFLRSKELNAIVELRNKCMRVSRESSKSSDRSHNNRHTQLTHT